jgi:hypothetical protein
MGKHNSPAVEGGIVFDHIAVFVGMVGFFLHPDFGFSQGFGFGYAFVEVTVKTFHPIKTMTRFFRYHLTRWYHLFTLNNDAQCEGEIRTHPGQ